MQRSILVMHMAVPNFGCAKAREICDDLHVWRLLVEVDSSVGFHRLLVIDADLFVGVH